MYSARRNLRSSVLTRRLYTQALGCMPFCESQFSRVVGHVVQPRSGRIDRTAVPEALARVTELHLLAALG